MRRNFWGQLLQVAAGAAATVCVAIMSGSRPGFREKFDEPLRLHLRYGRVSMELIGLLGKRAVR